MKKRFSMIAFLAIMVFTFSCGDDDEPEEQVNDTTDPVVAISSPADGSEVSSLDASADITIEFQATDETELTSVVVDFDGTQIEEVTSFTDFRNYEGEVVQSGVEDGSHTITITATDIAGNTSTATSTFEKTTLDPYTPMDGETLYMPFEGNYINRVTEEAASVEGDPGFAGEGQEGNNAYQGAEDAYLTVSSEDVAATEMTVSFYLKVNAEPDRAGIFTMSPPDDVNTDFQNLRTSGLRIFREARGDNQIIKANFGTGEADAYLDGGDIATVDPTIDEWHHIAVVIGATNATLYIDGASVAKNEGHLGMSLADCDMISIMSGVPRFTEWNHNSDLSSLDELRVFNKALTEEELETLVGIEFGDPDVPDPDDPGLDPIDGDPATEVLYMSFDTDFGVEVADATATPVGNPSVVDGGASGMAYSGDVDSYLTIPTEGLLSEEFSASMWIKLDPEATRAGILAISAEDTENPELPNNRTKGVRLFREGNDVTQDIKLNVGTGEADVTVGGGTYTTFAAAREEWLHVAFTVGGGKTQLYLNGILAANSDEELMIDWTGADLLSFGSGAPRFTGWSHFGETSMLDELRLYSGVLNPAQIAELAGE